MMSVLHRLRAAVLRPPPPPPPGLMVLVVAVCTMLRGCA